MTIFLFYRFFVLGTLGLVKIITVGWNVAGYLDRLEADFGQQLAEEARGQDE